MEYLAKTTLFSRILHHPIARIVLGIAVCVGATVILKKGVAEPILSLFIASETLVSTLGSYFGLAAMLGTYFFLFRFWEKRPVHELSLKFGFLENVGGFLLGFAVLSLVFLILYLLGNYEITGWNDGSFFVFPFSVLVLMAMLEEVVFRGIFYRILEEWKGTWIALIVSSVIFSVLHLANPNMTAFGTVMGIIFGMVHALMYTCTQRLWLPFAFHLGWNMSQPFWGSNLTGLDEFGVVFHAKWTGPDFLTGGGAGIEDSIFTTVVLCVIFLILLQIARKKGLIRRGQ